MSDKRDDLGDRMKSYESVQTSLTLDKYLSVYARLDGRGFSKFTKQMKRPFDEQMSNAMRETTEYLIKQTHAVAGYTQSDEISLVWKPVEQDTSGFFFEGKIQKLTSVLASMCTGKFMTLLPKDLQEKIPHFDCRILNVPDLSEAANMIVWRESDARKNAVSMLARSYFSHKELQGKSTKQMLFMLQKKNVSIQDYPSAFRNGTFLRRDTVLKTLTEEEKSQIPSHAIIEGPVKRTVLNAVKISPFFLVKNKVDVIFNNKEPEYDFDTD